MTVEQASEVQDCTWRPLTRSVSFICFILSDLRQIFLNFQIQQCLWLDVVLFSPCFCTLEIVHH